MTWKGSISDEIAELFAEFDEPIGDDYREQWRARQRAKAREYKKAQQKRDRFLIKTIRARNKPNWMPPPPRSRPQPGRRPSLERLERQAILRTKRVLAQMVTAKPKHFTESFFTVRGYL